MARSGDVVVQHEGPVEDLASCPTVRPSVFHGLTGVVKRLDKIALTGVNGAGKSTLLKIITGQADADRGELHLGAGVKTGYFSQYSSDILVPGRTVFEEVAERHTQGE